MFAHSRSCFPTYPFPLYRSLPETLPSFATTVTVRAPPSEGEGCTVELCRVHFS